MQSSAEDENKKIKYKLAEVDGKPVDETNIHKFITRGSRIIEGRIHMESTSCSTFGYSLPLQAGRLVIASAPSGTFEGDEEEATEEDFKSLKLDDAKVDDKVDKFIDSI